MSDTASINASRRSEADQQQALGHKRRRLLKALAGSGTAFAAGGVALKAWQQPVVKSIVLPAHASLTCGSVQSYAGGVMLTFDGIASLGLMDTLVSPAFAGAPDAETTMATADICIQCNGDGTVSVRLLLEYSRESCIENIRPYFERNNVPTGQTVALSLANTCAGTNTASIRVTEVNGNAAGEIMAMAENNTLWVGEFGIGPGGCTLDPPTQCIPEC